MRRLPLKRTILTIALFAVSVPSLCAQQILDRVLAIVDGKPLMVSESEDQLRFEALQQGRDLRTLTEADMRDAREHLVEREIIRQQIRVEFEPSEADVENQANAVRALFPEAATNEGWTRVLSRYGFTESEVRTEIADQLRTMRLIDLRLRPTIRVDSAEIANYYRDVLVPAVKAKGAEPDPLPQLRSKIEELLVQKKMTDVFNTWMTNLRSQSKVRFVIETTDANGTPDKPEKRASVSDASVEVKAN